MRLGELAGAGPEVEVAGLTRERAALPHHQARLQANAREGRTPVRRHLAPLAGHGAPIPEPSPGDVSFDLEGDPDAGADGIDYLWAGAPPTVHRSFWAE